MKTAYRILLVVSCIIATVSCNKISDTDLPTALLPETAMNAVTTTQTTVVTDINNSTQSSINKTTAIGYFTPVLFSLKTYFNLLYDLRRGYFLTPDLDDGEYSKSFTYNLIRYDDVGNQISTITVNGLVTAIKSGDLYTYTITLSSLDPAYYLKKTIVYDYALQKCKINVIDGVSASETSARASIQLVYEMIDTTAYVFVLDVHKNFAGNDIRRNLLRIAMSGSNPVSLFALHKSNLGTSEFSRDIYTNPPTDATWPSDSAYSWDVKIVWTLGTGGTIYYGGTGGSSIVF